MSYSRNSGTPRLGQSVIPGRSSIRGSAFRNGNLIHASDGFNLGRTCVKCGQPGQVIQTDALKWIPWWARLFYLLGRFPGRLLARAFKREVSIQYALCSKHDTERSRFTAIWIGAAVVSGLLLVLAFVCLPGQAASTHEPGPASLFFLFASMVCFAAMSVALRLSRPLRLVGLKGDELRLDGAGLEFMKKLPASPKSRPMRAPNAVAHFIPGAASALIVGTLLFCVMLAVAQKRSSPTNARGSTPGPSSPYSPVPDVIPRHEQSKLSLQELVLAAKIPSFPKRGTSTTPALGVSLEEINLTSAGPGGSMSMRLYLPAGAHEPGSLPCVLIAPAGTPLIVGAALGPGDQPEHIPYAQAGFAVLAFSLDGDVPRNVTDWDHIASASSVFHNAAGGLVNLRNAIAFLKARVPEVDLRRLAAAGHSSAATFALFAAGHDSRIKAVAAYAPTCDVTAHLRSFAAKTSLIRVPGLIDFADSISPIECYSSIRCPTLLFFAEDDRQRVTESTRALCEKLESQHTPVNLITVRRGGHYAPMISKGIPAGIDFFSNLFLKSSPTTTRKSSSTP